MLYAPLRGRQAPHMHPGREAGARVVRRVSRGALTYAEEDSESLLTEGGVGVLLEFLSQNLYAPEDMTLGARCGPSPCLRIAR